MVHNEVERDMVNEEDERRFWSDIWARLCAASDEKCEAAIARLEAMATDSEEDTWIEGAVEIIRFRLVSRRVAA